MSTLTKPPLPNYTVTTFRPCFGNLSGNSKIDNKNEKLNAERSSKINKFKKEFEKYKQSISL